MYSFTEHFLDDPKFTATPAKLGNGVPGVRLRYGTTTLRISIAEAVDLVDSVVSALAQLDEGGDAA